MVLNDRHSMFSDTASDAALLDFLTGPTPPSKASLPRRDAALDPLLLAAAAASGPHITRNHYHHDFFPGVSLPQAQGALDWTKWSGEDSNARRKRLTYVSRQAPRRHRLQDQVAVEGKENNDPTPSFEPLKSLENIPTSPTSRRRRSSLQSQKKSESAVSLTVDSKLVLPPLQIKCMARTRIPTPYGPVFLHLYHNNCDKKEHLALVADPAQYSDASLLSVPPIRSRSLDALWSDDETEMDRITRGAYVGKLTPKSIQASTPSPHRPETTTDLIPPPLVRIHSECFTGETVGSMRCDCGEQLDEAIRLVLEPISITHSSSLPDSNPATIPGRGAIIYLRQEGRGIGLLSKIRAYNLQDLGHDTVTANLMLGHQADERDFSIASAILRDLGLGCESGEGVRLLTNNPDKVKALESEGLRVVERVPMVPRSWKNRASLNSEKPVDILTPADLSDARVGRTIVGAKDVHGEDLDKYLRTKVLRMGHMLPLYLGDVDSGLESGLP